MKPYAILFSIMGLLLLGCVAWNIVAPSHLCWLGFWKGLGTFILAMVFGSAAGSLLEEKKEDQ